MRRVTGSNVLLYFKGGSISENGNSRVALAGPTTGAYRGLVVWQPASDTTSISISNGGQFALTGALYVAQCTSCVHRRVGHHDRDVDRRPDDLVVGRCQRLDRDRFVPGLSFSLPGTLATSWPVNTAYSSPAFTGAGGDGNYTWSASNLPAGLSMGAASGIITGTTPASAISKSVIVTLSDALGDDVATQPFTFTVDALPTVTTISPTSAGQGATNATITINGTKFISGAIASFSGTGVTVNSTTFVSATKLTASVTIAANAATGARGLTVTNPDTGAVTSAGIFTVNAKPTVTSTTAGGLGATNLNVTINGTGFASGAGLAAAFSGTGITVNSTTYVSAIKLTANVSIASNAASGTRDVTVTNGDSGVGTGTGVFTVNAAPAITSLAPNAAVKACRTSVSL